MQSFLKACDAVVEEAETKSLATLMNMPPVSLLQRANANYDGAWFNVKHLYALLLHTKDMRPLAALASEFGFDLVAREKPVPTDLNSALMRLHVDLADVTRLAHDAQADGHVCSREKSELIKEADEVIVSLEVFKQSVKVA